MVVAVQHRSPLRRFSGQASLWRQGGRRRTRSIRPSNGARPWSRKSTPGSTPRLC